MQKTDFPRGVGVPLLLMLSDSLDRRTLTLTADARDEIEFLAARLKSPLQLGGIQVAIVRGQRESAAIKSNLATLKRRVEQQLDDAGIPVAPQPDDGPGNCAGRDPDQGPSVCVDAWLKPPRVKNSKNDQHTLAGFEVGDQGFDLLAAVGAQRIGDRQEVAILTQPLGDQVGVQGRRVAQHDCVHACPELIRGTPHDLDGVVGREDEQLVHHGEDCNSCL